MPLKGREASLEGEASSPTPFLTEDDKKGSTWDTFSSFSGRSFSSPFVVVSGGDGRVKDFAGKVPIACFGSCAGTASQVFFCFVFES